MFGVVRDILPISLMKDNLGAGAFLDQIREVLRAEWAVTAEKGISDYAQGPHIDRLSVALLEHDFWGGIAKGAGHGGENFVLCIEHFGDAKVGEDEVGVWVGGEVKEVLRLEICNQQISSG